MISIFIAEKIEIKNISEGKFFSTTIIDRHDTDPLSIPSQFATCTCISNKNETSDFHGTVSFNSIEMSQQK